MSSEQKVVVINGKRFVVGNSKIKPTKCHLDNKRKKLLSEEEKLKIKIKRRREEKFHKLRKPRTRTRKCRL